MDQKFDDGLVNKNKDGFLVPNSDLVKLNDKHSRKEIEKMEEWFNKSIGPYMMVPGIGLCECGFGASEVDGGALFVLSFRIIGKG